MLRSRLTWILLTEIVNATTQIHLLYRFWDSNPVIRYVIFDYKQCIFNIQCKWIAYTCNERCKSYWARPRDPVICTCTWTMTRKWEVKFWLNSERDSESRHVHARDTHALAGQILLRIFLTLSSSILNSRSIQGKKLSYILSKWDATSHLHSNVLMISTVEFTCLSRLFLACIFGNISENTQQFLILYIIL